MNTRVRASPKENAKKFLKTEYEGHAGTFAGVKQGVSVAVPSKD
jgi:hypothetical protein